MMMSLVGIPPQVETKQCFESDQANSGKPEVRKIPHMFSLPFSSHQGLYPLTTGVANTLLELDMTSDMADSRGRPAQDLS
jgi:hypothetical protein